MIAIIDMVGKYYRWFNVSSKPLKDISVPKFLYKDIKKYALIDAMKCPILILKKSLRELVLWLETIENEEDIDHGMVSLFQNLHYATLNCANLNNTDQIFPDFANKHVFYDDDNNYHLNFPLYSCIKHSMETEFILIPLLSLGRFSTERKLLLNGTLRGCFCNSKLIGEEDDPEYL